jgi:hypothetical protein
VLVVAQMAAFRIDPLESAPIWMGRARLPSQAVRTVGPLGLRGLPSPARRESPTDEEVSPTMQQRPGRVGDRDVWMVERAVVLQTLRDDREERWSRAALAREIADRESALLDEALVRLERDGVLRRAGDRVWASRAARRLDELELIGV